MTGSTLTYRLGEIHIDPAHKRVSRAGQPLALTPKCFELLVFLVENRARVISKDELIQGLWPESFVDEHNLAQNIYVLRQILGDDRNGHRFIQTVPRRGYKFVASVKEINAAENSVAETALAAEKRNYWSRNSPFRSLRAFEPEDAWLFFGRQAEIDELRDRLGRTSVLAVVGNSGCGKSSLIRAGLIPALRDCHSGPSEVCANWRIALVRPSTEPFDYLAEALPTQLAPELSLSKQAAFIADCRDKLPREPDALRNAISALVSADTEKPEQTRVLLVVDQFEELFTLVRNRELRNRYIDALLATARWGGAVSIDLVLSLRADFYPHCLEHPELGRCLSDNQFNVPRMTQEQLRETIEKRLQLSATKADPGLVEALLEDVGDEPGNLALLEHALGQLWEKCGGPGSTLTSQAYSEIGRLRGALGRHADAVYESFSIEEQKLVQRIFLELVSLGEDTAVQDTRRRVLKADLLSFGAAERAEQVLTRLTSSRLIATGREGEEIFVEVSHETLIREWPRLRDWLTHNREELVLQRRLLQAAEDWNALNRDDGALLRGARLAQGEEWLARTSDALPLLRDFLQACITGREKAERKELAAQRHATTRARWFSCVLAVLLMISVGATSYTYRLQLIEKSHALAAQALEMRSHDQGQALNLAISSWRTAKTEEARLAVTKAFPQLLVALNHDAGVESVSFSPDGQSILTASDDHTARLWNSRDGHLLATLRGHTDRVLDGEFSPDGRCIVTTSSDHTARVWNAINGHSLAVLQGHTDIVWNANFSPDSRRIVTASSDRVARVWDAVDGRLLAELQGHTGIVAGVRFSPNGRLILTASWDSTARIWDGVTYKLLITLIGHSGGLSSAEFSPDGEHVVTAGFDHTARVWNSTNGRSVMILQNDGVLVRAIYSPDGGRIATAGFEPRARIWNSSDGRLLATLQGHSGNIVHIKFSPDSQLVLTDSLDRTTRIWSSFDGQLLAIMEPPSGTKALVMSGEPWSSAFSPDGRQVITAVGDPAARIWNIASSGVSGKTLQGHSREIYRATFSADGGRIATASIDGTARLWNSSDGQPLAILKGHSGSVYQATFSPDGKRIATAGGDKTARIWDSANGRLLATLAGHTGSVMSAQFSSDGQRIVTASSDHTARLWRAIDGRLLATLRGHSDRIIDAAFSPDSQFIVTAGADAARIWKSADGQLLATLKGHTDAVWTAEFSPDGRQIITAGMDHTARVWSTSDGRLLNTLRHEGRVWSAGFSADGRRIVTGSADQTARIWNSADGSLLNTLQGHTAEVRSARFSPDGGRVVTASFDGTARVWDSMDGQLLTVFHGHLSQVFDAAFSPDGKQILTCSADRTARIWHVLTPDDIAKILLK